MSIGHQPPSVDCGSGDRICDHLHSLLVHMDMRFCYCFESIVGTSDGLTSLGIYPQLFCILYLYLLLSLLQHL
jgi:hypothetical protein